GEPARSPRSCRPESTATYRHLAGNRCMSGALNANGRWLSIIGIGEAGLAGLPDAAKTLLAGARLVGGGRCRLARAAGALKGETMACPSPIQDAFPAILARRGQPVAV